MDYLYWSLVILLMFIVHEFKDKMQKLYFNKTQIDFMIYIFDH